MTYAPTVVDFLKENHTVLSMIAFGFDDHVASRACWRVGYLFQATILAEQAVEKLFKAGRRLSGDVRPFIKMGHKLRAIAQFDWFDVRPYAQLVDDLEHHFFNSRYPKTEEDGDVEALGRGVSIAQLKQVDELMLGFLDALPVDAPIKHSLGAHAQLFNRDLLAALGVSLARWETYSHDNDALASRLNAITTAVASNRAFMLENLLPGLITIGPKSPRGDGEQKVPRPQDPAGGLDQPASA